MNTQIMERLEKNIERIEDDISLRKKIEIMADANDLLLSKFEFPFHVSEKYRYAALQFRKLLNQENRGTQT